ncbi:sigma-54 interaction domain-containing protein [Sphingobium boeckii]|uniref:Sigma-54 specific flagellar transcriptional regulator A n=1 Tax=Sphingobium boeckii TaxID=1082345 RepID=A0A7W9AIR4_9SPHN|nr:sigma-54 dependent transcriptional regulator [Sphingobium boeckii]MBB5686437.1 sigma-54 specific flagellar transcriptional regulator A [Sphingobium boeckii]
MKLGLSTESPVDRLLVGRSESMQSLRQLVRQVAPTNASVLITGPSGSGKEMVARALHLESRRATGNFVAVNCGAIPHDLLESELFGHERGSFTGAVAQVRGRFEDADGGTLFLDEIGDMPPAMQVKLLRVLEERNVTRVGGRNPIPIDTRIISATHRDIDRAIETNSFREDLFYRLAVLPVALPSLAERTEDIPLLVQHFLERSHAPEQDRLVFSHGALMAMAEHRWPGNVRELRNVVERAAILYPGRELGGSDIKALLQRAEPGRRLEREMLWAMSELPASPANPIQGELALPHKPASTGPIDLRSMVADFEHQHILDALRKSKGVVADAARLLSLQRTTLIEKMHKYGVVRETV